MKKRGLYSILYGSMIMFCTLCFIPLIAVFICLRIAVQGFKISHGFLACLSGLASVIPIAAMQFFTAKSGFLSQGSLPAMLVEALVLNGVIEECLKMAGLFMLPVKKMELREFFSCSLLAGLTVASFEALVYLVSGTQSILLRLFTAGCIHTACAGLCGLFVYSARRAKTRWLPLFFAVVFHGLYDYFAMFPSGSVFFYFSFAVILFSVVECVLRYKAVHEDISGT